MSEDQTPEPHPSSRSPTAAATGRSDRGPPSSSGSSRRAGASARVDRRAQPGGRPHRRPPLRALGPVPRRAPRDPGRHVQGPLQRHRLPLPPALGVRAPHRPGRRAGARRRARAAPGRGRHGRRRQRPRGRPLHPPAGRPRHRASSSPTPATASSGWARARRSRTSRRSPASRTAHVDDLRDALAKDVGEDGVQVRVVPDVDEAIEALVEEIRATEAGRRARRAAGRGALRAAAGQGRVRDRADAPRRRRRRSTASRRSSAPCPQAIAHQRGERVDRGRRSSGTRARRATRSATTRSPRPARTRPRCTGPTTTARCAPGDLVLIDAGVEVDCLYTADITRTLPVNGTFTEVQRRVYEAVLEAADAGVRGRRARAPGSATCTPRRWRSSPSASPSGGCCR